MTVATATAATPDPIARLSVEQYHKMIQAGIFTDDNRVELLEGLLVQKMSKKPPHRVATKLVNRALESVVPAGWYVDSQEPITTDTSEPEPDAAIIRGDTRDYTDRHPGPDDIALVVEVADASVELDQRIKQRVYASASIAVFWIVNLIERRVQMYTRPSGPATEPGYGHRQDFALGESLPVVVDGKEVGRIAVADILP
jgi:Uma2 family endonuclease